MPPRFCIAMVTAATLFAATASSSACAIPENAAAQQKEVLANVNAERKAHGLSALKLSSKLDKAAQSLACDNAARQTISHESSDGGTLKTRLRKAGYAFRTAAENTGRGFGSGARVVEWWMGSDKHRDNILLRKAKDAGIGIAVSAAPDNKLHWILVVGAGR